MWPNYFYFVKSHQMKRRQQISFLVSAVVVMAMPLAAFPQSAKTEPASPQTTIVDKINDENHHSIVGSESVLELLLPQALDEKSSAASAEKKGTRTRTVYRVQVLSVNQSNNGKALANKRLQAVRSKFPQYPCDLAFEAPNFKVRIGVFETQMEANAAADKIRSSMSQIAKEVRVVRVNMKVTK